MTAAESELNRAEDTADPAGAADGVGYGKPPAEHRFKKGNRANPGGKRKVRPSDQVIPQLAVESFHEMLMVEARRMVRVKAGGRMVEIPALQSAFREVALKAARGSRMALATMAQLVMRSEVAERVAAAEREAAKAQAKAKADAIGGLGLNPPWNTLFDLNWNKPVKFPAMKAAEKYKAIWTLVLSRAAALNAEVAAPVPHPDDITIGRVRGTAHWPGSEPEEMLSLDQLAATHAELQADLAARRPAIEAMEESYEKTVALCEWFALDEVRELIEEHLPEQYAGQIEPDTRPADARARDTTLRELTKSDRERYEYQHRRDAIDAEQAQIEAEDAARAAARRRGGTVHGGGVHSGGEWGEGRDEGGGEWAGAASPGQAMTPAAEASIYRAAWLEMLEAAEDLHVRLEPPIPLDDVIIDAETETVSYRTPPPRGQHANLASLHETLARQREIAGLHLGGIALATHPYHAAVATCRRDDTLKVCAMIERHLGGARGNARP
ncbi:DUF5681 domain-containing protein [Sphingomonas sp.]|uniref:DUF5681 domain-containing protein n=1 Tax=Sphingomonas sp. TaxID=28214 RepID=UPI003D6D334D